jgi:hypothetical protein
VLSPEQQQVADQIIGQRGGQGRHRHRGGVQRG